MLAVNNIEVTFNRTIEVLHGVSVSVGSGQIVALLGANGAGKSTTLKSVAGMLHVEDGEVTGGRIEFEGRALHGLNTEKIARLGIVYVMEGRSVLGHLSVEENLRIGAWVQRDGSRVKRDLEKVYEYFPRLKDLRNRASGYLSGGEQQMLVIGRGLMAHPRLVLLDEPSLGLAPLMVKEIFTVVRMIRDEEKAAVLLVEQNARAALEVADYGYIMENGKVVLDGEAAKLRENEDIKEFYLGLSQVGARKSFRDVKHYKRRKRWL